MVDPHLYSLAWAEAELNPGGCELKSQSGCETISPLTRLQPDSRLFGIFPHFITPLEVFHEDVGFWASSAYSL